MGDGGKGRSLPPWDVGGKDGGVFRTHRGRLIFKLLDNGDGGWRVERGSGGVGEETGREGSEDILGSEAARAEVSDSWSSLQWIR